MSVLDGEDEDEPEVPFWEAAARPPPGEPEDPGDSDDPLVRQWAAVIKRASHKVHPRGWRAFARALEALANMARTGELADAKDGRRLATEFGHKVVPKLMGAFYEAALLGGTTELGVGSCERVYDVHW